MNHKPSGLSPSEFLERPAVQAVAARAAAFRSHPKEVSDILDAEGNQYVDLVQEGGGMLGIALVGYAWALEEAGIRFFSQAGTSAGAINTLVNAALGPVSEPKALKILEVLCKENMFDFVDGDARVKRLIQSAVEGKIAWSILFMLLHIYRIVNILTTRLGLNPGNNFHQWLSRVLASNNIYSLSQLQDLRKHVPGDLHHRHGEPVAGLLPRLVIVAAEVTTQTKVQFPEMADLYWEKPGMVNPAEFVRASMSIPLFFEPYRLRSLPHDSLSAWRWEHLAGYTGPLPTEAAFVDGGILSNFPINVFHIPDRVPRLPTFGVRLSAYRETLNQTSKLPGLLGAVFNTMRQIYDLDFLLHNPDYSKLICMLDTNNEFNWLDFNMSDENKLRLFERGASGAINFLESFDWQGYKSIRSKMIKNL